MRFMLLMIPKGYESAAPGAMPEASAVEAMMDYNRKLQQAGIGRNDPAKKFLQSRRLSSGLFG